MLLALVVACSSGPTALEATLDKAGKIEVPAEAARSKTVVRAAPAQPVVVPAGPGDEADVVLVWDGISPLHQSFFADPKVVSQLRVNLGQQVSGTANVHVRFDSDRHIGRIDLRLLPGQGSALQSGSGSVVGVYSLSPILQALAKYRSAVAARFDTRVEAFRIGIEAYRGSKHCRFNVAGQPPPDGTVLDLCVEINGQRVCGEDDAGGVRFEPDDAEVLRACLN